MFWMNCDSIFTKIPDFNPLWGDLGTVSEASAGAWDKSKVFWTPQRLPNWFLATGHWFCVDLKNRCSTIFLADSSPRQPKTSPVWGTKVAMICCKMTANCVFRSFDEVHTHSTRKGRFNFGCLSKIDQIATAMRPKHETSTEFCLTSIFSLQQTHLSSIVVILSSTWLNVCQDWFWVY